MCNCIEQAEDHLSEKYEKSYKCLSPGMGARITKGSTSMAFVVYPFTVEFGIDGSRSKKTMRTLLPTFCCVCGERIGPPEEETDDDD